MRIVEEIVLLFTVVQCLKTLLARILIIDINLESFSLTTKM